MSQKRSAEHNKAQRQGKARDNFTCQICGAKESVEGHHIIDVQFNGASDKDNIITLCSDHHKKAHKGKLTITKF